VTARLDGDALSAQLDLVWRFRRKSTLGDQAIPNQDFCCFAPIPYAMR
jgi:hypothetical protein